MNAAACAMTRARDALTDLRPKPDDITADALEGLSRDPKTLPSKYFYDAEGSRLFEAITHLPEYYLTRTELALLEQRLPSIAQAIGPGAHVVEYGSGSGRKTELLLEHLHAPVAYTPVEISRTAVVQATARLSEHFPAIEMLPVCADFTRPLDLPQSARPAQRTVMFFPGSTLGNFTDEAAQALLDGMRQTMGPGGCALVGIDLDKEPALIEAAYNDAAGITAAFTLNLLARLNREIGSDFDLDAFAHRAVYVRERLRIETFLVSQRAQTVKVGGRRFDFAQGEAMQVEYSHKYTDARFAQLAARAGLKVTHGWNDARDWFGLRLLQPL
ncbi:L-histidine N(alpha)-methyltransferase [Pseudoxanthomonas winnipegensis]|uniref:L-histidine N(alpha)-methyltransferase n=1 Tax=Pseudoxanthomonas winnipegensis TaxID=2480810 RepID=UPI0030F43449